MVLFHRHYSPRVELVLETGDFYLITIEFKLKASGVVLSPSTLVQLIEKLMV